MMAHTDPDRLLIYVVSLSSAYSISRWATLKRFHEGRGLPSLGLSVIACFVLTPLALDVQEMLLPAFVGIWCVTHSLIFLFEVDGRVRWMLFAACVAACLTALSAAFQMGRPSLLWIAAAIALLSNVVECLGWSNLRTSTSMLLICLLISSFTVAPNTALENVFISCGVLLTLMFSKRAAVS